MAAGGVASYNLYHKTFLQHNGKVHPLSIGISNRAPKVPFKTWKALVQKRQYKAAKQIIACILISGFLIVALGTGLTCLGFLVISGYDPWSLIGLCIVVCGFLVMLLSIELCWKRKKIGFVDDESDEEEFIPPEEEKKAVVTPTRIDVQSEENEEEEKPSKKKKKLQKTNSDK